ncbi:hypothetical protein RRG08_063437 [Elysia crispata]|uniref:Uncharacterized protein n=1 Tax=Elysia crispata TaxID=231223 RepID=A0AAE1AB45_9GAST|nr:hypothetical protein RRG08_063437 [Elysia crispata]
MDETRRAQTRCFPQHDTAAGREILHGVSTLSPRRRADISFRCRALNKRVQQRFKNVCHETLAPLCGLVRLGATRRARLRSAVMI